MPRTDDDGKLVKIKFCHMIGTSRKDRTERREFNENHKDMIESLNLKEKCMQCDCYIMKQCNHKRCEKVPKCSTRARGLSCTRIAAHVEIRGRKGLILTCRSCNSRGGCPIVYRKSPIWFMPLT